MNEGEKTSSHFFFDWEIPNFSLTQSYVYPEFSCYGGTWRLKIYQAYGAFKEIYLLILKSECSELNVNYQIGIKGPDGVDYFCKKEGQKLSVQGRITFDDIAQITPLLNKVALKNTSLKISCALWIHTATAKISPENSQNSQNDLIQLKLSSLESVSDKWKDLFLSQRGSDVIIKVNEQQIHAHKVILEAQSKVLAAMFQHDMKENSTGIIEISDFEPEEVKDFFLFMYCGNVDILKSGNVFKIYKLSDKYDVEYLKKVCSKFMERNMDVGNICEILLIAENYNEEQLKEAAKLFLARHLNEVLSSHQWEVFSKENSFIAHCILKKIILDNASKIKLFYET